MNRILGGVWRVYYFGIYIPSYLIKEHLCKIAWNLRRAKPGKFEVLQNCTKKSRKLCIFATYPEENEAYFQSLENVLNGLTNKDYKIIMVCNRKPNNRILDLMSKKNAEIIVRDNRGRDFAAYQVGIQMAKSELKANSYDNLILINDTLYWGNNSEYFISELEKHAWSTLYLNLEGHTHAQSFLLHFKENVFLNEKFTTFWDDYVPLNSKRHLIHRGEIALTSQLLSIGLHVHPIINAEFLEIIFSNYKKVKEIEHLGLGGMKPAGHLPRRNENAMSDSFLWYLTDSDLAVMDDLAFASKVTRKREFLNWLVSNVYSDPPHRIGLHLTYTAGVPLKKDIYKFQTMGNINFALDYFGPEMKRNILSSISNQMQNYMRGDLKSRYLRKLGEK